MAEMTSAALEIAGRRQLFIDDWLVAETHGIARVLHQPTKYVGNPVIHPTYPLERAITIYGAILYDPAERLFPHVVPGARPDWLRRVVCHLAGRHLLGEASAGYCRGLPGDTDNKTWCWAEVLPAERDRRAARPGPGAPLQDALLGPHGEAGRPASLTSPWRSRPTACTGPGTPATR